MRKIPAFLIKLLLGLVAVLSAAPTSQATSGRIVYFTNVPDNGTPVHYQIYIINGDGTGNTRLNRASDDLYPELSPDGTTIAFVSSLGDGIYLMNSDGTGAAKIPNTESCTTPSWSADGTKLAAVQTAFGSQIVTFNRDGSAFQEVTLPNNPVAFSPAWSPDGTKISFFAYAYEGGHATAYRIYVVNADGSNAPVILSTNSNADYRTPSWSPDGAKIICNGPGGILLLDPSTGAETVVPNENTESTPTFSPDGTEIAFQEAVGSTSLGVMKIDGANRRIYDTPRANSPKWSRAAAPTPTPTPTPPPHGGLSDTTFQVNESTSPVAGLADSVLRFEALQSGIPAGLNVRVQRSTTPTVESSWQDLADGNSGKMSYAAQVTGYVLNSTSYPTVNGVYFRAISFASGYSDSISNVVGPFDLASTKTHLAAPLLFITTNGEVNAIRFGVNQAAIPAGISVRVQTTKTPALETSWTDAPIGSAGHLVQDPANPNQFYLGTDDYTADSGVYFRAVASAPDEVDGLSFVYGPFTFVSDPAAAVTISVNDVPYAEGNTLAEAAFLPSGTFSVKATATSGRFLRRLTLVYDGVTVGFFADGATSGKLDYNTNIPGDHLVEALATDDLGVTGAAPPVHVRILPHAPGRIYEMTKSGDWNTAGNWIDIQGKSGVPGPNDFAIVGTFNATLAADTTVNAVSLDGGSIANSSTTARTLTATGFCTIAGGQVKSNLTLPSGSTGLLINDADIGLSGTLTYAGIVRLHGKGGITGVNLGARSNTRVAGPDGLFDFVKGVINGVGQFFADLASGGRKGSKSAPLPPPNPPPAPELRTVNVAKLNISGTLAAVPAPVISNDGGSLISQDGGSLISQDGGGLVASGGGNLVASGGGNLISQDGGGLLSQDGGGLVASGGGNLVATGGGNLVASGGGNLISQDGGGAPQPQNAPASSDAAAAATSGYFQTGGETNLNRLTITGPVQLDGGVLSGSGLIFGSLTNNSGYISPGHSAGGIGVVGTFAQGAAGTLILEDGGAGPAQYDQLHISGAATLGGTLDVRTINGYTPDPADTFNPFAYALRSGMFDTVSSNAATAFNADGLLVSADSSLPQPFTGQLLNIATRNNVGTGENVMIAGFIITGSDSKKVLIRGLGPELTDQGVSGALADPTLELHKPDGSSVSNDNWKDTQQTAIQNTGLAPTKNLESAIVATLAPGAYTAILAGKGGVTGVGLVEVYDLDEGGASTLANIATRGIVQTGNNVLIGGIIVGGSEPGKILVRAIGPSLTGLGVAGALADPVLELHDANGGVTTNDNWRETQEAEIVATSLAPTKEKESAILATLVPGNYTAVVRGAGDTTGVALIEAYALP